jgi:hypothetical protein
MDGSSGDIGSLGRDYEFSPKRANKLKENTMKALIKYAAPWLAFAAIGGAIAFAPTASADTDPLVPYGTNPHTPYILGFHESNHDEANTTNGQVDVPF